MQHFYVYILISQKDHRLYIGYTNNLKRRLTQHAKGEVISTRNRRPLKLIHYEYFIDEVDAKSREVFLKSGAGHKQIKDKLRKTLLL